MFYTGINALAMSESALKAKPKVMHKTFHGGDNNCSGLPTTYKYPNLLWNVQKRYISLLLEPPKYS